MSRYVCKTSTLAKDNENKPRNRSDVTLLLAMKELVKLKVYEIKTIEEEGEGRRITLRTRLLPVKVAYVIIGWLLDSKPLNGVSLLRHDLQLARIIKRSASSFEFFGLGLPFRQTLRICYS